MNVRADHTAPGIAHGIAEGTLGGVLGTLAMSVVMIAGQRLGLMGQQPPEKIAVGTIRAFGGDASDPRLRKPLAAAGHLGFGAGTGGLFGFLHRHLRLGLPAELHGVVFALGVWAVSYKGWIPAVGIMPQPERDRPGRPLVMILAHVVYGAVLGRTVGRAEPDL